MCMITYKIVPVQSSSVQNAVILMKGMKKVFLEESMGFQKGKIIERVKGSVWNEYRPEGGENMVDSAHKSLKKAIKGISTRRWNRMAY